MIREEAMREQAFNTMRAIEALALAISNLAGEPLATEIHDIFNKHTNTSGKPEPRQPFLPNGKHVCLSCGLVQFIEAGRRMTADARDTCECLDSPYSDAAYVSPPEPYTATRCSLCKKLQHQIGGNPVRGAEDECRCKQKDGSHPPPADPPFWCPVDTCNRGDGAPHTHPPGTPAGVADKLHRAIALLTMKMFEKEVPFDNPITAHQIYRLLGLRPCEECRGTGWLARDESCKSCKRAGWLSA